MKSYIYCVILGVIIAALTVGFIAYTQKDNTPRTDFAATEEVITHDLTAKWVTLVPQGQLWAFAPDQKISLKIIETKPGVLPDRAIVAVEVSATADIPTEPEPPKEQRATSATTKNMPVTTTQVKTSTVQLSGIAKLHYEKIGSQWYLLDVEPVALSVRAK